MTALASEFVAETCLCTGAYGALTPVRFPSYFIFDNAVFATHPRLPFNNFPSKSRSSRQPGQIGVLLGGSGLGDGIGGASIQPPLSPDSGYGPAR